jgi:hypothetical protein
MAALLWILAVLWVMGGVIELLRKQLLRCAVADVTGDEANATVPD